MLSSFECSKDQRSTRFVSFLKDLQLDIAGMLSDLGLLSRQMKRDKTTGYSLSHLTSWLRRKQLLLSLFVQFQRTNYVQRTTVLVVLKFMPRAMFNFSHMNACEDEKEELPPFEEFLLYHQLGKILWYESNSCFSILLRLCT